MTSELRSKRDQNLFQILKLSFYERGKPPNLHSKCAYALCCLPIRKRYITDTILVRKNKQYNNPPPFMVMARLYIKMLLYFPYFLLHTFWLKKGVTHAKKGTCFLLTHVADNILC